MRDLAMFNLAIDSKLRDCDLIWVRIDDVCAGGRVRESDGGPEEDRSAVQTFQRRRCLVPVDDFYEWKKTA